jgi:hypothetical protein
LDRTATAAKLLKPMSIGNDERVHVDDAGRSAAGFVDDKAGSHGNFPLRNRASVFNVMPT